MVTTLIMSLMSNFGRIAAGFVPTQSDAAPGPLPLAIVSSMNMSLTASWTVLPAQVARGGAQTIRIVTSAHNNGQIKASF